MDSINFCARKHGSRAAVAIGMRTMPSARTHLARLLGPEQ